MGELNTHLEASQLLRIAAQRLHLDHPLNHSRISHRPQGCHLPLLSCIVTSKSHMQGLKLLEHTSACRQVQLFPHLQLETL
uniref:Uncharacterized protein n=1 Tax=Arundo donax TaxID=35708 RepID=A0A0A9E359_ARUDO